MKIALIAGACALVLAGCSAGGDFIGSPRGYLGTFITPLGTRIIAAPTIVPDGNTAMDTYINTLTGVMATKGAALLAAKRDLCMLAPNAAECTGMVSQ